MFAKVVQIMKYQNENTSRKRALFSFKNRIDRLFQILGELIGENPLVWRSATNYAIEML